MIDALRSKSVRCDFPRKSANSYRSAKSDRGPSIATKATKKKTAREKIIVNLGKIAGQFRKEKKGDFSFSSSEKFSLITGQFPRGGRQNRNRKKSQCGSR